MATGIKGVGIGKASHQKCGKQNKKLIRMYVHGVDRLGRRSVLEKTIT